MTAWAWGPIVVAVCSAVLGPKTFRALPPASAVRLATALAVIVAMMTGLVLALAAELTVTQIEAFPFLGAAQRAGVSGGSLAVGSLAAVVVLALVLSAGMSLVRAAHHLHLAWRDARELDPNADGLVVVVADAQPSAFAVTGYPGRVVVTTAMLHALNPEERRALIAHETAHLHHHHQLYIQAARVAAAANPLLRPLARLVARGTERWADEAAASAVGDRELAARAVARAALAAHQHAAGPPRYANAIQGTAAESPLAERVSHLLAPPPQPARRVVAAVLAAALVCTVTGFTAAILEHGQVERVETAVLHAQSR